MLKFNYLVLFAILVSSSLQYVVEIIEVVDSKPEDDEPVTTEVPSSPSAAGVWTPDLNNSIWTEMNFPVEPEEDAPPPVPYQPLPLDLTELNLTAVDGRIAGGRQGCQCGRPRADRVINGVKARINDIPWTVALSRKSSFGIFGGAARPFCGGTLINNRYVVTASHCVDGQTAKGINVYVNEQELLTTSETIGRTETFGVEKIIMNPGYNRRNIDHDIALIKLDRPIDLTNSAVVVPVCLPANNDADFAGQVATVAGWGTTMEGGRTSDVLQKVDVPVISNSVCNSKQTKYLGRITDNMLCAGDVQAGGKDACQGDSGGPLIIDNGTRKTLIGVVSWGFGCGRKMAPGVYARVARYPDWILANTKDAEWCTD